MAADQGLAPCSSFTFGAFACFTYTQACACGACARMHVHTRLSCLHMHASCNKAVRRFVNRSTYEACVLKNWMSSKCTMDICTHVRICRYAHLHSPRGHGALLRSEQARRQVLYNGGSSTFGNATVRADVRVECQQDNAGRL